MRRSGIHQLFGSTKFYQDYTLLNLQKTSGWNPKNPCFRSMFLLFLWWSMGKTKCFGSKQSGCSTFPLYPPIPSTEGILTPSWTPKWQASAMTVNSPCRSPKGKVEKLHVYRYRGHYITNPNPNFMHYFSGKSKKKMTIHVALFDPLPKRVF